jgi:F-type H+-transporting ATPase subunit alpha
VAGDLRLSYSQFEELEAFARFGTQLDEETRKTLERGRRVREILKQPQYQTIPVAEQVAALVAVNEGVFDELEPREIGAAEKKVRQAVSERLPDLCRKIERGEKISEEDITSIKEEAEKIEREKRRNGESVKKKDSHQ